VNGRLRLGTLGSPLLPSTFSTLRFNLTLPVDGSMVAFQSYFISEHEKYIVFSLLFVNELLEFDKPC
jgi:hypothetical protein